MLLYLTCSVSKEHCHDINNIQESITTIQHRLQDINSLLSTPQLPKASAINRLLGDETSKLEKEIDDLTDSLVPLRNFIIPSGGLAASHLHLSRAICRRTERTLTEYMDTELSDKSNTHILAYVNRLSDYLFTAARYCANIQNYPEIPYSSLHSINK